MGPGYPKLPKSWGGKLRNSLRFVTRANYATSPPLATVGPGAPMLWLFCSRFELNFDFASKPLIGTSQEDLIHLEDLIGKKIL